MGHGPLPESMGPADQKTEGECAATLPVGRTVVANDTEQDKAGQAAYSAAAFGKDMVRGRAAAAQLSHLHELLHECLHAFTAAAALRQVDLRQAEQEREGPRGRGLALPPKNFSRW